MNNLPLDRFFLLPRVLLNRSLWAAIDVEIDALPNSACLLCEPLGAGFWMCPYQNSANLDATNSIPLSVTTSHPPTMAPIFNGIPPLIDSLTILQTEPSPQWRTRPSKLMAKGSTVLSNQPARHGELYRTRRGCAD
jgi:hypothetical protein